MIQFEMSPNNNSKVLIVGVGGGGNNAVNYMHRQELKGVKFLICNTDVQVLDTSRVENKIQLGPNLTKGLGAGFNPKIGEAATIESKEEILGFLQQNVDMVFITAGMGGGTGTGGAPVVAQLCKELGILTVAVVTTPFSYEGKQRKKCALEGIAELKKFVDIIIIVSNDKIREYYGSSRVSEAFSRVDDVVSNAIKSITNIIYSTGTINVDFADVSAVMKNGGLALMGVATANGENRAACVAEEAISSPLLDNINIKGATQILLNITTPNGDFEITPDEIECIQKRILDEVGFDSNLILGLTYNEDYTNEISLTLIITGFGGTMDDDMNESNNNNGVDIPFQPKSSPSSPNLPTGNQTPTDNLSAFSKPFFREQNSSPTEPPTNSSTKNFFYEVNDNEEVVNQNKSSDHDCNKDVMLHIPHQQSKGDSYRSDRENSFKQYSVDPSRIFYDKKMSEINFSVQKESEVENNQFLNLQIKNDNNIDIKKKNEYDGIYNIKRPD